MLSFFVEESRAGESRHPEPFSSTSLNSAPRSEWQVAGRRGRALGVRLQRRGARLRLPGRTAQPAAAAAPRGPSHLLGPPPHPGSARPPVAGSREGGRSTGWLCAGRRCCRLDCQAVLPFARNAGGAHSDARVHAARGKHAGLARL